MIELYSYATSNGQRASIMLEECGLPYKGIKVDLEKGEQKQPNFLKLNPLGQIPVLVDGDRPGGKPVVLAQSAAIILYLAEKVNRLLPREPMRRAAALQWFMQAMTDVAPSSAGLFALPRVMPEMTVSSVKLLEQRLLGHFRNCDKRLAEGEFLAGEFSIADIALYPTAAGRKDLIDQAGDLPFLTRWQATMAARPTVQKGMKVPG